MSTNKDVFIHALKIQGSVKDSPGSNERMKPEGLFQSVIYSSFRIQRGESAIYFFICIFLCSCYLSLERNDMLVSRINHKTIHIKIPIIKEFQGGIGLTVNVISQNCVQIIRLLNAVKPIQMLY